MSANNTAPRLAIVAGDPAGIGPELVAKLLNQNDNRQRIRPLLMGDRWIFERGAQASGLTLDLHPVSAADVATGDAFDSVPDGKLAHLDLETASPEDVPVAQSSEAGGRCSLAALGAALHHTNERRCDAMYFAPLNKHSLHLAGMGTEDELHWFARELDYDGPCGELNVLDDLWTTRVTSHVPLKDVVDRLDEDGIIRAIRLANTALDQAGITEPRVGVAALNPHGGDNGSFGREEIDLIRPAVEKALSQGLAADGPYPADTVFVKAFAGEFDAVVTMYHDQGQIAMKVMGFDRGVTVQGGLPVPIATPGHGTAFDIVGKNKASMIAAQRAFDIAVDMGATRLARG